MGLSGMRDLTFFCIKDYVFDFTGLFRTRIHLFLYMFNRLDDVYHVIRREFLITLKGFEYLQ